VGVPSTVSDAALRELIDTHQIRNLVYRYARGLDRGDWQLVRSCFAEGATDDHGAFQGGVDNLIDGARTLLQDFWGVMHLVGQVYIELDGDKARSETYAVSFHRRHADPGDEDTLTGLRYLDRLARVDGEWKIVARVTVHEWNTAVPANDWLDSTAFVNGRRDASDASYALGLVGRWQ
jgi:hypothetical protein